MICFVANKADLYVNQEVTEQEGRDLANSIEGYFQLVSSKTGNGVSELRGQFTYCYSLKSIVIGSSVNKINGQEFQYSKSIENVYYYGTKENWDAINISSTSNDYFINATRYYYSETEPSLNEEGTAYDDNYWHYVDGEVVVWTKL